MAGVYSVRFIATASGAPASYTVPAGNVAVIRCVTATNHGASAVGYTLAINPGAYYVVADNLAPAGTAGIQQWSHQLEMRVVVRAGETMNAGPGSAVDMTVSGYLFPS